MVGRGSFVRVPCAGGLPVVAGRERARSAADTGFDPPGRFLRDAVAAAGRAAASIGDVRRGAAFAFILRARQAVFDGVAEVVHAVSFRAREVLRAASGAARQDARGPCASGSAAAARGYRRRIARRAAARFPLA